MRLTKINGKYIEYSDENYNDSIDNREMLEKCLRKLAEYEYLEEQGLLLRLPCKVGDTVYCIRTLMDFENAKIQREVIVEKFRLEMLCDIGYAYFLTKAEAEQKLNEKENR